MYDLYLGNKRVLTFSIATDDAQIEEVCEDFAGSNWNEQKLMKKLRTICERSEMVSGNCFMSNGTLASRIKKVLCDSISGAYTLRAHIDSRMGNDTPSGVYVFQAPLTLYKYAVAKSLLGCTNTMDLYGTSYKTHNIKTLVQSDATNCVKTLMSLYKRSYIPMNLAPVTAFYAVLLGFGAWKSCIDYVPEGDTPKPIFVSDGYNVFTCLDDLQGFSVACAYKALGVNPAHVIKNPMVQDECKALVAKYDWLNPSNVLDVTGNRNPSCVDAVDIMRIWAWAHSIITYTLKGGEANV